MSESSRQRPFETAALELLYRRVDFERFAVMPYGADLKLERMRELLARLGDPQRRLPAVHLAGTKGKGSTAAMLAAILTQAGYRTGRFTSPHLERIEERIAVDGVDCSAEELVALVEWVRPAVETMDRQAGARPGDAGPTFFEVLTAMAFGHFRRRSVDVVVLEVGLGGRLDSTNVCEPLVSIITSISLDHCRQLGDTLAAIAGEKAGIIKPGVPVVSGVLDDEPRAVIRRTAHEQGAPLVERGVDFDFRYRPAANLAAAGRARLDVDWLRPTRRPLLHDAELALAGQHQGANASLAIVAVDRLRAAGWRIGDDAIREGLRSVRWPARFEVIEQRPRIVLDGAHNVASSSALAETLDEVFPHSRRVLVFGTSLDKDADGMLELLMPKFEATIFARYTNNPRGMPLAALEAAARQAKASGWRTAASPREAADVARKLAGPEGVVCVAGSFYLVAETRPFLTGRIGD